MVGKHECSCLTSPSDLSAFHNVYYNLKSLCTIDRSLCSQYGTLSCRKTYGFEPEGWLQQCQRQAAWHATNMQCIASWNLQPLLMHIIRCNKKARRVPASANESLFTWLLHLLQVNWGWPQWILRWSCHAEYLPRVSQSYQTSGTYQTAITSSHWTQPRTRDIVGAGRFPENEMQKLLHHNLLSMWQNNKGDKRMAQGIAAFLPLYSYRKLT